MQETTRRQSLFSTFAVMAGTMGSRVLGFVRIALISLYFGGSGQADILNAVFNIPNNFRKLLAEGALSSAFIPELSREIHAEPREGNPKELSRSILGLQILVLLPLSFLCVFFPEIVLKIFIRFQEPWKTELAVRLFRWLFHYILLISISAVLMAVLNSSNQFLIPALSPLLFSISVITSIFLWHECLGIFSMALGVLVGGAAQILWQYPLYRRLGYSLKPGLDFKSPGFKRVIRQWLPVLVTSSIFTINQQIAVFLATGLADGSTTGMSNAIVFWQLPFGIFSASIITVLFPKMSRQASAADWTALSETLQDGMQMLGLFLIPSSLLLMIFGPELISTALQRGAFEARDSSLTARILYAYAPGMFFVGCYNLFQRSFYARGDYAYPLRTAAFVVALDVILSLLFIHWDWGALSLGWANSAAMTSGALVLGAGSLKSRIFPDSRRLASQFSRIAAAQIPMVGTALFFKHLAGVERFYQGSSWYNFFILTGEGLVSLGVVLLFYYLMKLDVVKILERRRV